MTRNFFQYLVISSLLYSVGAGMAQPTSPPRANSRTQPGAQAGAKPQLRPSKPLTEDQAKLRKLGQFLREQGISDLSKTGKMSLAPGAYLAVKGLATPSTGKSNDTVTIGNFRRYGGDGSRGWSYSPPTPCYTMKAQPLRTNRSATSATNWNYAYWLAQEIVIPDNTTIILAAPNTSLIFVADKITFGNNVTLTYQRKDLGVPPPPSRTEPVNPSAPSQVSQGWGTDGVPGKWGQTGAPGYSAPDNQSIHFEIWSLDIQGFPYIDAKGQDGGKGGPGATGSNGGVGGKGADGFKQGLSKYSGQTGGLGGAGGRGGDGGPGGAGQRGGTVSIYAPQAALNILGTAGVTVDITGGAGGAGGDRGQGGNGGQGGPGGDQKDGKQAGSSGSGGPNGTPGNPGPQGPNGGTTPQAYKTNPITADDYAAELTLPFLGAVTPPTAKRGDIVALTGTNFTSTDTVYIANGPNMVPCQTQFTSNVSLLVTIPTSDGGTPRIEIRRANGTLSANYINTLTVLPVLDPPTQALRLEPGKPVTLTGSGFAPGCQLSASWANNGHYQFASGEGPTVIDGGTLTWTAYRPPSKAAGTPVGNYYVGGDFKEAVELQVSNNADTSNKIQANYDNFVLFVVGDSMAWGTGNRESDKHYSKLASYVRGHHPIFAAGNNKYNSALVLIVKAHTGAILGWRDDSRTWDTTVMQPIYGEIPTDYPTIKQQFDQCDDSAGPYVDLVVVFGGINDINFKRIMNPWQDSNNSAQSLIEGKVDKFLFRGLKAFLRAGVAKMPNARFLVCNYALYFSDASKFPRANVVKAEVFKAATDFGDASDDHQSFVANNAQTFMDYGRKKLREAVVEINDPLDNDACFLVSPAFNKEHALWGNSQALWSPVFPEKWENGRSYGLEHLSGIQCVRDVAEPTEVLEERRRVADSLFPTRVADKSFVYSASTGHPNPRGMDMYFEVMKAQLGY